MMLTSRFDDGFLMASRLHRTQRRKGADIPYLSHLMAVAALVMEYGGDEDQAIAALLHDAVEDQGGAATAHTIKATFGPRVSAIVLACSDSTDGQKAPWATRKRDYLSSLKTKDTDALLVTACDKLHNASAILADFQAHGDLVFDRFTATKPEVLWYYDSLATALSEALPGALTDRLRRTTDMLLSPA